MLGLHCCAGYSLVVVCGPLIAVASLAAEHGLPGMQISEAAVHGPSSCSSRALEHRLSSVLHGFSYSTACGIFPDQGSHACLLHWQAALFSDALSCFFVPLDGESMGHMIFLHKCITEVCRFGLQDIYFIQGFGTMQRLFFLLWRNTEFWNETEKHISKC